MGIGCGQTMHIERTLLSLDAGSCLPGIVRCLPVQSRQTLILSPVDVAVDMLRRKNAELESLVRRYADLQQRHGLQADVPGLSLNPLTMALKGVVDPAVMGGVVKYQQVGGFHSPRATNRLYCFRRSSSLLPRYSRTAALSLMQFCTNMYLDNRTNPIEFQGHRLKVKVIFSLVDQRLPNCLPERGKNRSS